jgi:protein involved in polysaccharide export with SLBB domain
MNYLKLLIGIFYLVFPICTASGQIEAGKGSLTITISGVPEAEKSQISGLYPVSENGNINMPYIGQIRAVGFKCDQLGTILQQRYKSSGIYTNPTIQVVATDVGAKGNQELVTLGGQIRKAGPVPYIKGLTLWEAIQTAGGPTEFGSMKRVRLTREGKTKEYNLNNGNQFRDIQLQRNDTIEIPQKRIIE